MGRSVSAAVAKELHLIALGTVHQTISDSVRAFIEAQRMFFVATAPRSDHGHINLSPKGLDCFRVLAPNRVAYLDYTGSGIETVAHIRENGRLTIMFCAFEGKPNILRLYGKGEVLEPQHEMFETTLKMFEPLPAPREVMPVRSIIAMDVTRISDSCGFGVPLYQYQGQREQLLISSQRKGVEGLREYQRNKNASSLDGLPGLGGVESEAE